MGLFSSYLYKGMKWSTLAEMPQILKKENMGLSGHDLSPPLNPIDLTPTDLAMEGRLAEAGSLLATSRVTAPDRTDLNRVTASL